jgi:hypothetical protein
MYRITWFALGFIAYGLLELAAVAIISRYFPDAIRRLQRIGDSLYQAFRQKDGPDTETDDTEGNGEGEYEYEEEGPEGCTCPLCTDDADYAPGTTVAYQDPDPDAYGALKGTVLDPPLGDVYSIDDGSKHTRSVLADNIAPCPDGGIIPEGTPVTFYPPTMGPAVQEGITYRARVFQKTLWYLVEYGVDGDVKQECVAAKDVKPLVGITGTSAKADKA